MAVNFVTWQVVKLSRWTNYHHMGERTWKGVVSYTFWAYLLRYGVHFILQLTNLWWTVSINHWFFIFVYAFDGSDLVSFVIIVVTVFGTAVWYLIGCISMLCSPMSHTLVQVRFEFCINKFTSWLNASYAIFTFEVICISYLTLSSQFVLVEKRLVFWLRLLLQLVLIRAQHHVIWHLCCIALSIHALLGLLFVYTAGANNHNNNNNNNIRQQKTWWFNSLAWARG